MTGFLQRLAERATGAAHPLRAVSTAPFAPLPDLPEEMLQPVDVMNVANSDVASPMLAAAKHALTEQKPGQGANANPSQRSEAMTSGVEHDDYSGALARSPAALEPHVEASAIRSASTPPTTLMPRNTSVASSPAGEVETKPPSPSQALRDTAARQPELRTLAPETIAKVEPLLPLAQPAREPFRPTANASNGNSGRSLAGLVEETTEVLVSIGRIEVTAVHEPAPPKPAASRRNAPMSLDDYLAKRYGNRT
jgi:hypothetical protein